MDSLVCSLCDTAQLVPIGFSTGGSWPNGYDVGGTQQWAAEGVFDIRRPAFETGLRIVKEFAHSRNLPRYQHTETCFCVSSIRNNI